MKLFKRTVTFLIVLIILSCTVTYFVGFHLPSSTKIPKQELNKITDLLNAYNISVKDECLPKSYPNLPSVKLKNSVHDRYSFASEVLGKHYTVFDSKTFISDKASLLIDANGFVITFPDKNLFADEFSRHSEEKYGSLIKKAVLSLGFDSGEILVLLNKKDNLATVYKTVNNTTVLDCFMSVHFSNKGISKINGIWFDPIEDLSYKKYRPLISIFNEICQNPEFYNKTITDITAGYKIGELSEYKSEAVITPVWRITFGDMAYDFAM